MEPKSRETNSLRSLIADESCQIDGKIAKIGLKSEQKKSLKRGNLPAISHSIAGEVTVTAVKVPTSFPGRYLGVIVHDDGLEEVKI